MARILEKLNDNFLYFDSITKSEAFKLWDLCKKSHNMTYIGFKTPFGTLGARGIETNFIKKCIDVFGGENAMHRAFRDAFKAYFMNGVKIIFTTDYVDVERIINNNLNCKGIIWSVVKPEEHGEPFIVAHGLTSLGSTD